MTDEVLDQRQAVGGAGDGEGDEHPEEEGGHAGQRHIDLEVAPRGADTVRRDGDDDTGSQGGPERRLSLQHQCSGTLKLPGHMRTVLGRAGVSPMPVPVRHDAKSR